MKHKKVFFGLCAVAILVVTGFCYTLLKPANDKDYVARQYDQIAIPQSLGLKEKKWDDRNGLDPAINSAWTYTYTINANDDTERVASELKSSLKRQGFAVEDQNSSQIAAGVTINAKNDTLSLWIVIGVDAESLNSVPRTGQEVSILAEKSK